MVLEELVFGAKVRNLYMWNCKSIAFVKYNIHKNPRFFQLVLAKILGNYENKTVCFLDYLIFNKDHIICSGMTHFIERRLWHRSFSPRFFEVFVLSALLESDCF